LLLISLSEIRLQMYKYFLIKEMKKPNCLFLVTLL
jgi:hypothetical protein